MKTANRCSRCRCESAQKAESFAANELENQERSAPVAATTDLATAKRGSIRLAAISTADCEQIEAPYSSSGERTAMVKVKQIRRPMRGGGFRYGTDSKLLARCSSALRR